jgi:hypothetical protein
LCHRVSNHDVVRLLKAWVHHLGISVARSSLSDKTKLSGGSAFGSLRSDNSQLVELHFGQVPASDSLQLTRGIDYSYMRPNINIRFEGIPRLHTVPELQKMLKTCRARF